MFRVSKKSIILFLIGGAVVFCLYFFLGIGKLNAEFEKNEDKYLSEKHLKGSLVIIQGNTLAPIRNKIVSKRMFVVVTGYSSSPEETDNSPLITASGGYVRDGVVANNLLPFGTEIRIPEIFGDKIFVVEDRMHWRKGYYHIDVWFPTKEEAKRFGAKRTYIEILEG
ncbi:MAG TPA: hypothetical protein ENF31_00785 [bacterium]|nr:hypothetical protein [bacterium]